MYIQTLFLMFATTVLAQGAQNAPEDVYPQGVCWVVVENASLALRGGDHIDLDVGDMLAISEIVEKRLRVSRLRLLQVDSEGWIEHDRVGDCFETMRRLDPKCTGRALTSQKAYLALAQAYNTVSVGSTVVTSPLEMERYLKGLLGLGRY